MFGQHRVIHLLQLLRLLPVEIRLFFVLDQVSFRSNIDDLNGPNLFGITVCTVLLLAVTLTLARAVLFLDNQRRFVHGNLHLKFSLGFEYLPRVLELLPI